jgi:hypothetical protein
MFREFSVHVGLLKKLSPSIPISMERLIHNALRKDALLRNVPFSFCNSAWKFLLKLCISQIVVIALRCNDLQKMGYSQRNSIKEREMHRNLIVSSDHQNRSENKFCFDV